MQENVYFRVCQGFQERCSEKYACKNLEKFAWLFPQKAFSLLYFEYNTIHFRKKSNVFACICKYFLKTLFFCTEILYTVYKSMMGLFQEKKNDECASTQWKWVVW